MSAVQVETEVFDKMDELVFSGEGDEEYAEMFKEMYGIDFSLAPFPIYVYIISHTVTSE